MTLRYLLGLILAVLPAGAQIIPDRSLGNETTRTVPVNWGDLPIDRIEGGALRGQNLFHSLQEFNVSAGRGVYFSSPGGVQNIITRVTGDKPSAILGTLGVLGNSNLFLLNPKGIVFGGDSKLDIGGAFIATTGSSFIFDNNQVFSAVNPQAPPLLLVKTPLGVQMGDQAGNIINRSVTIRNNPPFPLSNVAGLQGNIVNLIGGNIEIQGGITAAKISLAAVREGLVAFNPDFTLSYNSNPAFGDILLARGQIDGSGNGAGTIAIRAKNLTLTHSEITAYTLGTVDGGAITLTADNLQIKQSIISATTFGRGRGGDLTIEARESLGMTGEGLTEFRSVLDRLFLQGVGFNDPATPPLRQPRDFGTGILALSFSAGDTGNITVATPQLTLDNGSFLSTLTFVAGRGGDLKIVAPAISLDAAQLNAESLLEGNSGNILVQTQNFSASTGAVAAASTFGRGKGGNVTIVGVDGVSPADQIKFAGSIPASPLFSGIFANTFVSGQGGAINILARDIELTEGASIASVAPVVPALNINSSGNGGNITVTALNSITLDGSKSEIGARSANTGNAGKITVTAKELNLRNDAMIDSSTADLRATGSAGEIQITVDTLRLDNQGRITANTRSGKEGNININADRIELRRHSRISTDGGTSNGGNITINSNILLAFPTQNSDITANARTSAGGRVTINAIGILGFTNLQREQIRDRLSLTEAEFAALETNPVLLLPSSDIAAISQTQATIGGTVTFNTSGLNPGQFLVELPQNVIDPNTLVVSQACSQAGQNSFVVKGRGGLPENPQDVLHFSPLAYQWLPFIDSSAPEPTLVKPAPTALPPLADALIRNDRGELQLVSYRGTTLAPPAQPCRR